MLCWCLLYLFLFYFLFLWYVTFLCDFILACCFCAICPFYLNKDWGCVILREIDFLLKICWSIRCLHSSWKVHTWIEICASLNHRKKMKADGSRLIPRKHTETLVLLSVFFRKYDFRWPNKNDWAKAYNYCTKKHYQRKKAWDIVALSLLKPSKINGSKDEQNIFSNSFEENWKHAWTLVNSLREQDHAFLGSALHFFQITWFTSLPTFEGWPSGFNLQDAA